MEKSALPAIVVLKETSREVSPVEGVEVVTFDALRPRLLGREAARRLFHYRSAALFTYRHDTLYRPLRQAILLRLLCRGPCWFEDDGGNRLPVTPRLIGALAAQALWDAARLPWLSRQVASRVGSVETAERARAATPHRVRRDGRPIYLRTDLVFDNRAGGSIGHIAGVVNSMGAFFAPPLFVTTDRIPGVRPDVETRLFPMPSAFRHDTERYGLHFTVATERFLDGTAAQVRPAFVYQRYSRANFSGLVLSRRQGVPLVLEYNGSELWVSRNWGARLRYGTLTERIELLNLRSAEVVVVVSRALKDELVSRGIDETRILVNPNGVDPDRYSPAVSGEAVRARYGLEGRVVIGFIGTFGRWHGAEVLAAAFGVLLERDPALRGRVKLLMIGAGTMLQATHEEIAARGLEGEVVFTGLIPQEQGPEHLAACNILVAPHVANPDGSTFFGSPTKLFEYMATGRGIVASRLGQMAEVLKDGRTALLTEPGDAASLAQGLLQLVRDARLREDLGRAARAEVLQRYSWKEHMRRMANKLWECCA